MKIVRLLVLLVAALDANASAAQEGLTLQEALNLPSAELAERVLGQVGRHYPEVQRPNLSGLPGRLDFGLEFASVPRSAGFPGLCQADVLSVAFWPASETSSRDEAMHVNSINTSTLYRVVADTSPSAGWNGTDEQHLAALCERFGPVFDEHRPRVGSTRFFGGGFARSGAFWPAHAYFAVRALQKAMAAASAGPLAAITCRGETAAMTAMVCANPRRLLSDLDLARLNGFNISPCQEGVSQLCVDAGLSLIDDPRSHFVLNIRMTTDLTAIDGGILPDFNLLSVQIQQSSFVN